MNDSTLEINTAEVAKTGRERFPAVAGRFKSASAHVNSAQSGAAAGLLGSGLTMSWSGFNTLTDLFFKTSATHLEACGDVLVRIANDHAWTDEKNKYRIGESYHSTHEKAVYGK